MARQFERQSGVATSNPPALLRWATSKVLTRLSSAEAQVRRRKRATSVRMRSGGRHQVEYFHQVDDAYGHLAAQLLAPLLERYDVDLVCHLVRASRDANLPEPDLLLDLARSDSAKIAPHYGLTFPGSTFPDRPAAPNAERVDVAERILAAIAPESLPEAMVAVGTALWSGDDPSLDSLAERYGCVSRAEADTRLEAGVARRAALGHYSSAMFHCGGEWYWGADRFFHLENRLVDEGASRSPDDGLICPRPGIESGPRQDDGSLTLEFYPSLRSPYTSIIFDRTVALARDVGVTLEIRPVLPMVMRGVPATRQKGVYIFTDTGREARALGLDWGHFYDPIGEPVRNAYSLYPWAEQQGKGTRLLSSFLRAAFFEGRSTNSRKGMKKVVEEAGLSWSEAARILGNRDWEDEIERNRLAMYAFGCWGVPSYRLLDEREQSVLATWGQDRLWLVSREIQRLLKERAERLPT